MEEPAKSTAGQGFGIASLILGILALLIAFIPCVGIFALIPGLIAIVLAIVGLSQANSANGSKGIIISGLVISILGTTLAAAWLVFFSASGLFLEKFGNDEKIQSIIEEFVGEFENEYGKEIDEAIDETDANLENTLDALEKGEDFDSLSDEEKAGKVGKATGKALKEFNEALKDTTNVE